jgi:hypothetical protein
MRLARHRFRALFSLATFAAMTFAAGSAGADKLPLLGSETAAPGPGGGALSTTGEIVVIDGDAVECARTASFEDLDGGASPGTSYDIVLWSGTILFGERFQGQTLGNAGDFDVVSGTPSDPLTPQAGSAGQNLNIFTYVSNVLVGLGHIGFPDIDAIGEGSIALYFPAPQRRVGLQLVGGNGGSATLDFYRADGSLIDSIVLTGLGEFRYGFETADATNSIAGILIQSTDASGVGLDDVCYEAGVVSSRSVSWGTLKTLYR